MWAQAVSKHINSLPPENHGWIKINMCTDFTGTLMSTSWS